MMLVVGFAVAIACLALVLLAGKNAPDKDAGFPITRQQKKRK